MANGIPANGGDVFTGYSPLLVLLRSNLLMIWRKIGGLRHQSRLLTAVIVVFVASYLVLAFWLFHVGLRFLDRFPPLGTLLVERLMYLLFFFLFALLLLSNLIISYTNFFRNRESAFLLTLPIPRHTVFQWKMIESTVLASWAFLFLIAPLVAAFGMTRDVPWHFYPMTTAMVALFIFLPAALGACLSVLVARYLDRRLFQVLAVLFVLSLIAFAAFWLKPDPIPEDLEETRVLAVLNKILHKTRFAQFPFLPSHWMSSSVLLWSDGALLGSGFFGMMLLSYVMFFGFLACTKMGVPLYEASSAVHSRGSIFGRWRAPRARAARTRSAVDLPTGFLERLVGWWPFLRVDQRALIVKDTRMFWRDTTQWAQSLMLFGLLGVYIFNLRHFTQQLANPFWIHLVSYLNLGACSLNLATLTTRFVFPQFSLEGKRMWIVGMSPLGIRRILQTKFWLAAITSELVTLGLIVLSCHMLQMPWSKTLFFAGTVTIMTLTLTGLAIGLGALYPNFREENPSKIVSGFGGTFCLVLSFLYILGSVILLALASPWRGDPIWTTDRGWITLALFLGLSLVLGWLPYRLGLRHVLKVEL